DVFSDLVRDPQGRAHVVLKGKQQQLEIMLGPNWQSLVMWSPNPSGTGRGSNIIPNPNAPADTGAPARGRGRGTGAPPNPNAPPPDPNFICFEPMAGITNALNLAQKGVYKELKYIQTGGTWRA